MVIPSAESLFIKIDPDTYNQDELENNSKSVNYLTFKVHKKYVCSVATRIFLIMIKSFKITMQQLITQHTYNRLMCTISIKPFYFEHKIQ